MKKTLIINDLDKIKLLSDPLKLQLIQAFSEEEKTTIQVAAELGESVTKLYRHVDALFDAGLIVIASEKKKRGTVERTFRSIAKRFEADPSLFASTTNNDASIVARQAIRSIEDELVTAITDDANREENELLFARLRCKASPARIAELRSALEEWIEQAENDPETDNENTEEVGALLAFYPIK